MGIRFWGISTALVLASGLPLVAEQQAKQAAPPPAGKSLWSGVYSEEQAAPGEKLYAANCANCHGPELEGTAGGPALTGPALSARWAGKSLADLFEYQQAFMPWNSPGGFLRPRNVDILAYVLKKGAFRWARTFPCSPTRNVKSASLRPNPERLNGSLRPHVFTGGGEPCCLGGSQ